MNNLKKALVGSLVFLTVGCTSATVETLNKPIQNQKGSVTITEQKIGTKSLKRVIAIGRFTDETKRGNSFLLDDNGNRVGKQASDILSARLASTDKFIMLERSDLELILKEGKYRKVGAKYLIVGSVSQYGRSTVSDVGVFSRNKKQKANVTVNIRIIDTKSGQIIYSEEGSGEAISEASSNFGVGERAGYDLSLDDKALSSAISKLTSNVMNNLLDDPWQSYILSNEGGNLIFAGGEQQGIKRGDTFDIVLKGKEVTNPQTSMKIQLPGEIIASIKVDVTSGSASNEISIASIISGKFPEGDLGKYIVQEVEQ